MPTDPPREHASADAAPELYDGGDDDAVDGSDAENPDGDAADADVGSDGAEAGDADVDSNRAEAADAHLDDVVDGAGCTEIWEHLSERRGNDDGST